MEFEYFMFFLDLKYPNPIRTQYRSENYGYFTCILILDPNRSELKKNRTESEQKIYKYLLGPNI